MMRKNAIIVSTNYCGAIDVARAKAIDLGMQVTEIVESYSNGVRTILVAPDGSKEGWPESDSGDNRREAFKTWMDRQRYSDGSSPLSWVEVQYGDDEGETVIVAHSDEDVRCEAGETDIEPTTD